MATEARTRPLSVGVDIESISRFKSLRKDRNGNFLNRVFTEKEIVYCYSRKDPAPHLAVRFAGKEAVIKAALGLGLFQPTRNKIEILGNRSGAPKVRILGRKKTGAYTFRISLSHSADRALAFVVAVKK